MKDTMKLILTILLIFTASLSIGQSDIKDSVCNEIFNQIIKEDSKNEWVLNKKEAKITWTMIDTIFFEPGCCGPSIHSWDLRKIDTVTFTLRFENEWNKLRVDSLRQNNIEIVENLKNELIRYCDSINWRIKIVKKSFMEYPYTTLKQRRGFSKNKKYDILNVVRLPDVIIKDVGVFLDLSFDYEWFTIYQERPRLKLDSKLTFISFDILGANKMITGRFEYE